jgi:hypothetical protein
MRSDVPLSASITFEGEPLLGEIQHAIASGAKARRAASTD